MRWCCRAPRSTCACASRGRRTEEFAARAGPIAAMRACRSRWKTSAGSPERSRSSSSGATARCSPRAARRASCCSTQTCRPSCCCRCATTAPTPSLDPLDAGGYLISTAAPHSRRGIRDAAALRAGALRPAAAAGGAHRCRAACLFAVWGACDAARAAQVQLPAHAHAGAAAGDAVGDLPGDPFRAETRATRAGPDAGHARGGQGRFRHAAAAVLARRDGVSSCSRSTT